MRLLVLGGTRFVGRHIVDAARTAGHEVAVFHRGETARDLWPDVEDLIGDRRYDLPDVVGGRSWDAVVDTSAYTPRVLRASLAALRDRVSFYAFVSTVSVYASFARPAQDETAPVAELDDPDVEDVDSATYGGLKVLCERELLRERSDAFIVRPGIVVGPYDHTDRFTYWVDRIARGGRVVTPAPAERPVQFIDARDLGSWIVRSVEGRLTGVFNAVGPAHPLTFEQWLRRIRDVAHSDARFVWVDQQPIESVGVAEKLPFWVPPDDREWRYVFAIDGSKAIAHGLRHRPLEETIADTLQWSRAERRGGLQVGLSPEEEDAVLREAEVRA